MQSYIRMMILVFEVGSGGFMVIFNRELVGYLRKDGIDKKDVRFFKGTFKITHLYCSKLYFNGFNRVLSYLSVVLIQFNLMHLYKDCTCP